MSERHRSAGAREIGGLDVVAALRHGRRVARLSQRDLARRAGVSQSLIARIEARRVDPPVGLIQRLLGFCGMRWDLKLTPCGASSARSAACAVAVHESASRRASAAGRRRMAENAAARQTAARLADNLLTVRQKRAEIRAARLGERARQAASYSALVASDDEISRAWLAKDESACDQLMDRTLRHLALPLAEHLPVRLAGHSAGAVRQFLETLSRHWPDPPVALAGRTARAVWSPTSSRRSQVDVELAPLRSGGESAAFLIEVGALGRAGGELFDFGDITLRLRRSPPPSTTLVRWHLGNPARALPVARPEGLLGATVDRHCLRAVLTSARRDGRGRRYPPYHEALGVAVSPWWSNTTIVRP